MAGGLAVPSTFGRPPATRTPAQRVETAGADLAEANAKRAGTAPSPSMYHDPNSGSVFQWRPGSEVPNNGGWAMFSAGAGSGGHAAAANTDPRYEDFDYYGALAKARAAQAGPLGPAELPAHVVGATPADAAAAQSAEFGRAKDRIGKLGRGSLMSLQESFQSRGLGGSGMEGAATQGLLSDLQGQEGEVIRDQAIQNLVRQRQVEDRNYAGDVNQRSQDIGFKTTTRGQDATYELGRNQQLAPLMSLIAAHPRRLY